MRPNDFLKKKRFFALLALLLLVSAFFLMKRPNASHLQPQKPSDLQILELNARAYLKEKGYKTFDGVPDEELRAIADSGINSIWMMGVWEESKTAAMLSRQFPAPEGSYRVASAYAIAGYNVNPDLGGENSLRNFVNRAAAQGLRVILDLIPNHHAIDSPLIGQHPDWFLHLKQPPSGEEAECYGAYELPGLGKTIWVAYARGTDVTYRDNAQFDFLNPGTWVYLNRSMERIAALTKGGGVRIDLLDLLRPGWIQKNSYPFLTEPEVAQRLDDIAWQLFSRRPKNKGLILELILEDLRKKYPDFKVIGEIYDISREENQYWANAGIDLFYSKAVYDQLVFEKNGGWLGFKDALFQEEAFPISTDTRSVGALHFLENHDETKRVLAILKEQMGLREVTPEVVQRSELLGTAITTIPGVPLIYMGQMEGSIWEAPSAVWFNRSSEPVRQEVAAFYKELLNKTKDPVFRRGKLVEIPTVSPVSPGLLLFARVYEERYGVVALNHDSQPVEAVLDLPKAGLGKDLLKLKLLPWESHVSIHEKNG